MKSKLNSISVRIKRKIKENKHVEKGFRKLKSYLDLYSPVEFQSFDSIHPVSLDSLIHMMKGGYKKNKALILSKNKEVFIDASEIEKVSCLVEQYKKLYLKDVVTLKGIQSANKDVLYFLLLSFSLSFVICFAV